MKKIDIHLPEGTDYRLIEIVEKIDHEREAAVIHLKYARAAAIAATVIAGCLGLQACLRGTRRAESKSR